MYEDYEELGLDDTVNNALKQINEKNYEQKLKDIGITTIYKYGIAFRGKACKIAAIISNIIILYNIIIQI